MAAEARTDLHHRALRCLLVLFDAASESLVAWEDYEGAGEGGTP